MSLRSEDFNRAIACVGGLTKANVAKRKAFNRFAMSLPHLLYTNGLSQTVAFLKDKANESEPNETRLEDDERAARMILDEIAGILGVTSHQLLAHTRNSDTMRATFDLWRLQSAWAYQRRYAEALLGATVTEE
jgi:CRISPR type III-B/RAMP module-associated protein Cmr5